MAEELRPPPDASAAEESAGADPSEPATIDADPAGAATASGAMATQSVRLAAGSSGGSAPRSVPSMPRVGIPRSLQRWERYQVLQVIGAGGMGAVYMARDPRLNRMVALKIVHPRLGHSLSSVGASFIKRFEREARLQASLEHPHICKVYEIGELPSEDDDAGYPYIAMQLINGKPLQVAQGEMSLFEKVRVIKQVAEALHAAHRQGLIHRDIKPSVLGIAGTAWRGFPAPSGKGGEWGGTVVNPLC